ncbi:MAG: hypothetical protein ACQCN3_02580 [Candidatus Bathyarchaeia archaeon]|jgi:hypothetical protein
MDIDKIGSVIKQGIALVSVNVLAYVYDGQFLWLAIGLDALALGYNIKDLRATKSADEAA